MPERRSTTILDWWHSLWARTRAKLWRSGCHGQSANCWHSVRIRFWFDDRFCRPTRAPQGPCCPWSRKDGSKN